MRKDNLVINRNTVIIDHGDKCDLVLNGRGITVTISSRIYYILKSLVDNKISIEQINLQSNSSFSELIEKLYFYDILLEKDQEELIKDGLLHNPARMNKAALPIPDIIKKQWCFFGAPVDFALDPPRSPAHGPYIFRKLGKSHTEMLDIGDIAYTTTDNLVSFGKKIQHAINKIKEKNNNALMIGGDHSLTYFAVKEISRFTPEIILIQFDAHSDINNSNSTVNIPLYHANFISKLIDEKLVSSVIQIGVRERTQRYERNYLDLSSIQQFPGAMNKEQKSKLTSMIAGKKVYITFDADVLDPEVFPHVTTPLDDGMNAEEVMEILKLIKSAVSSIEGADIMEFTCGFDEKGNLFNNEIFILDKVATLIAN